MLKLVQCKAQRVSLFSFDPALRMLFEQLQVVDKRGRWIRLLGLASTPYT